MYTFMGNVIIQNKPGIGNGLPSMSSIIVKLPNWMGDILFSYDLLFSLSSYFERIAVCTADQHTRLFKIFPLPNVHVIGYPDDTWPHLNEDTRDRIREFHADWGLLLPNSVGSAIALRRSGVKRLAGYDTEHRGFLLEKSIPTPFYRVHQSYYYLELLKLFDAPALYYPVEVHAKKNSFVVIHPGASKMQRAWNLDRFVDLAGALSSMGKEVMFVSGHELREIHYPVAVRPSLFELAGLLKECSVFIGNDSGPLHLAQQCGAPVVGIYGPGDPLVTGPRPLTPSRVVYHGFPCSPCRQRFFKDCSPAVTGKPLCVETISSQEVLQATLDLIKSQGHEHLRRKSASE